MDDYGIETGDYFGLALRLGIKYVPGFPRFKLEHGSYGKVMRDRGGRKPYWTPKKFNQLRADVDRAKKEHGFATDDEALRHLARSGEWARQSSRDSDKWRKTLKNALAQERAIQRDLDRLLTRLEQIRPDPEN
jgi:hypothetical protein